MARKLRMLLWMLALLLPAVSAADGAEYIHGYFRYTVADQSITITAYTGRAETVTVPSLIGSTPVNAIAAGAFSGNHYVKTVYLPDTITSVAEGAFAPGQKVVYRNSAAAEPTAVPLPTPRGVYANNGDLIAVDDEGRLLRVDADGNAVVLDDQHRYLVAEENGEKIIRREDGAAVTVGENGSVILLGPVPTATDRPVQGDPKQTPAVTEGPAEAPDEPRPAEGFGIEEAEAPEEPAATPTPETAAPAAAYPATAAPETAAPAATDTASPEPKTTVAPQSTAAPSQGSEQSHPSLRWIVGGLGVLAAVAVVWRLRRRKKA